MKASLRTAMCINVHWVILLKYGGTNSAGYEPVIKVNCCGCCKKSFTP